MELPFNLAMDLAWNTSSITSGTIPSYLTLYAAREFGSAFAEEIASVLLEYSSLVGMRRFEHLRSDTYSTFHYDESSRVLSRWKDLASRTLHIYDQMSEPMKPAFYQLVSYPIVAGATFHTVMLGVGKNYKYALERRNSANALAHSILEAFDADYDLTAAYHTLLDGKWNHMMSQAKYDAVPQEPKNWASPSRDMLANLSFVQMRQDMQFSLGSLGIWAEGSDNAIQQGRWAESVDASMPTTNYGPYLPGLNPYSSEDGRYVELFHRGDYRSSLTFSLRLKESEHTSWVSIHPSEGTLEGEHLDQRVDISITDWDNVPYGFNDTVEIEVHCEQEGYHYPYYDIIRLPVLNKRVPEGYRGFAETAGWVSIEGPHSQNSSSENKKNKTPDEEEVHFESFPHVGTRSSSGSIALRPFSSARTDAAMKAWASYNIYLFAPSDAVFATVYLNAGLDTDPNLKMQFSLSVGHVNASDSISEMTRVLGDYEANPWAGDIPPGWMEHVADQVWARTVELGPMEKGENTVFWRANSPEVYLEKIVLWTRGQNRASYLGPPESKIIGEEK